MTLPLPQELQETQKKIIGYVREYGLDFFETRFIMVDYKMMNQLAAYDGFPSRYPHWRFGMEYERMSKSYAYGLHRIYEMVINTDPCYAYLLASNLPVDQKLVMAHVYGHCDFFKNNMWFAHTNRKMLDEMANHATRVRRYMEKYGREPVENFLDACLSLDNLIDVHAAAIRRRPQIPVNGDEKKNGEVGRFQAKEYMDSYINPPDVLAREKEAREVAAQQQRTNFPAEPERDVLLFLMEYAPLENWQRDILGIIREEAYYFAPQRQTKIMNEGWATLTHSRIMTERALEPHELIDYAAHHSGTVAMHSGQLNPYRLGLDLFRDIEDRWNRGAFGSEYERCEDMEAKQNWDTGAGLGRERIFEVRRVYNDIGFLDTFLTEEFAHRHKLFTFAYAKSRDQYEIASREFADIKRKLLFQLTNFGQPLIEVLDANYENRGELLLIHRHEGIDLDIPFAEDTLKNMYTIWGRPVHVSTLEKDKGECLFSHDADGFRMQPIQS